MDRDYADYIRLFPELATGDPPPSRAHYARKVGRHSLVAEVAGQIVGWCYAQPLASVCYLRHLIVDPRARRRGIGRLLMGALARRCRAAGLERWALNVKPDNIAAVRLYEAQGMIRQYAAAALRMGWEITAALPAPDGAVAVAPLTAARIPEVEAAFSLPAGLLAPMLDDRALRLRIAERAARPVGLAAFDPSFPGAFPFRARSAGVAKALLEAMRPAARPTESYVQLVVEDDPALIAQLVAAGARVHLEFEHYAGPVPRS